jgi:hypothetical protein
MKKYLMSGIAAVVMCAAFTSCSHDVEPVTQEQLDQLEAEKAFKNYESAFIATFGQPAANQTWGFSGAAFTRTENANANEWADPKKEYGGLLVPPPLTPEQIAVVTAYFQSVKDIPYNDPQWTDYFIQQVYKGYTAPKTGTNPTYNEPYSPEAYMALNGTTYLEASDYMNHLAAIDEENNFFDHINNFNHGDCGENDHVLDKGGNANDGPWHTDKIMYMTNSTTKSFGYYNSNGSLYHNEFTGLVNWKTIHDWAVDNYEGYDDETGCLKDDWNRSYMGFDFEQMIEGQCYASNNEQWDYSTNPAKFISSTPKELIIYGEYFINGTKQTNYVYQYNDQPVKLLSDQMNRYCGVKRIVTDNDLYTDLYDANNNNAYLGKQLNTDFIDGLLADGYLPIDNKSLREWAIVGGCADGYYSDWIVTLTKAEINISYPKRTSLRVMAEDLSASEASDFDFNDIVFDVYANEGGTSATIILKAAGGTLPLRINGDDNWEVHKLFGVPVNTMVNTGAAAQGLTGEDNIGDVTVTTNFPGDFSEDNFCKTVGNILIEVNKNGVWMPLTAKTGEACCKFGCDPNNKWVPELENIDGYYNFSDWVKGFTTTLTAKKTW